MDAQVHTTSMAFTYAWWLTGDEHAAEQAVARALTEFPPEQLGESDQLAGVLGAVRRHAAPSRTMCPASELALLHDSHELALDEAAGLVEIHADDARTELGHGRLEALLETVTDPFRHPERLGGLAVGNPPDIAHARVCASCERVRELLIRGRQELCALPMIPAPAALVARVRGTDDAGTDAAIGPVPIGRHPSGNGGAPAAVPPGDADATEAPAAGADASRLETASEVSDPAQASRVPEGAEDASRGSRRLLVVAAALLVGVLVLVVTALTGTTRPDAADGGPSPADRDTAAPIGPATGSGGPETDLPADDQEPVAADGAGAAEEPADAQEPDDARGPDDAGGPRQQAVQTWPELAAADGFSVRDATVLTTGGDTVLSGRMAPLRVAITYAGAGSGTPITARLQVPTVSAAELRVRLVDEGTHVLVWAAPPQGWPAGRHQVAVDASGEIVALVTFTVS